MAYDTPLSITYSWSALSFATNGSRKIRGPRGKVGRLVDAMAHVTTTFVGTTTPAFLRLGPTAAPAALLELTFGAAGAGTAAAAVLNAANQAGAIKGQSPTVFPHTFAAADVDLEVNMVAGTGGAPAGVADVFITIEWS
jgi:hypothetical protein